MLLAFSFVVSVFQNSCNKTFVNYFNNKKATNRTYTGLEKHKCRPKSCFSLIKS